MQPRDPQFDTRLIIFRLRQVALGLIIIVAIASFGNYVQEGLEAGDSWLTILFPLCIISLLFVFFPQTEQWEYKPWQSKAQKVEQQSSGK